MDHKGLFWISPCRKCPQLILIHSHHVYHCAALLALIEISQFYASVMRIRVTTKESVFSVGFIDKYPNFFHQRGKKGVLPYDLQHKLNSSFKESNNKLQYSLK